MAKTDPFFKVMLRTERGAKWENWTVYRDLDDAILAAEGLITSDLAVESEVIWARSADDQTRRARQAHSFSDKGKLMTRTQAFCIFRPPASLGSAPHGQPIKTHQVCAGLGLPRRVERRGLRPLPACLVAMGLETTGDSSPAFALRGSFPHQTGVA